MLKKRQPFFVTPKNLKGGFQICGWSSEKYFFRGGFRKTPQNKKNCPIRWMRNYLHDHSATTLKKVRFFAKKCRCEVQIFKKDRARGDLWKKKRWQGWAKKNKMYELTMLCISCKKSNAKLRFAVQGKESEQISNIEDCPISRHEEWKSA